MSAEEELHELQQRLQQFTASVAPRDDLRQFLKLVRSRFSTGPLVTISDRLFISFVHAITCVDPVVVPVRPCPAPQSRDARVPNAELVARYGTQLLSHYRRGLSEEEGQYVCNCCISASAAALGRCQGRGFVTEALACAFVDCAAAVPTFHTPRHSVAAARAGGNGGA
jgi:hypothetical protein